MVDKMTRVNDKTVTRIIGHCKDTMAQNYSYNDWFDISVRGTCA